MPRRKCRGGVCAIHGGRTAASTGISPSSIIPVQQSRKNPTIQNIPTVTPNQANILNQLLQQGYAGLQQQAQVTPFEGMYSIGPLGEGFINTPLGQELINQFETRTIPSIAERFTAMGGSNLGSSGLRSALQGGGMDLIRQLQAGAQQQSGELFNRYLQQQQLQQQAQGNLFNQGLSQLQLGLGPQFSSTFIPRQTGWFRDVFAGAAKAIPYAIGAGLGAL